MLVNGDKQLEQAHRQAVKTALSVVEERYASTRIRQDGERFVVNTGNLIVAQFHHDSSREKDPQLHTHAVVINGTQSPDGKWYSLRNDDILTNQKLLSEIYQNELAHQAKQLGYSIEQRESGHFELLGYTPEQLEHFSKRRKQIIEAVGADASAVERELASLKTRKPKGKEIPRAELQEYWQAEAKILGIEHPQPKQVEQKKGILQRQQGIGNRQQGIDQTVPPVERGAKGASNNGNLGHQTDKPEIQAPFRQQNSYLLETQDLNSTSPLPPQLPVPSNSDSNPNKAVNEAIEHCSERNVNFKREEMEKFILSEIGNYSWRDLQKSIDQNQNLLQAKDNQYTTLKALNRELDTIRMVNQGKGTVKPIATPSTVQEQLKDKELTEGQYNAVMTASTSKDSIIAWQGKAGAGKTYALSEYKQIVEEQGYTIKGYAPSAAAAKVLGEELGIESNTVARKLTSQPKEEEQSQQQIWIVDEAGLLSAKDTHALLKRAEQEQARVLLVGDTRQLSAVEAGNPFKSLLHSGMETAYLNQSMRQKTQDLKQAVDKISDGRIAEGIKILDDNKRIFDAGDNRAESIANDYLKLTPSERRKTLILAGTNADREDILNHIREQLKQEGTLRQHTQGTRLKSKDLTSIQNKYAHHYRQGDVVMPLRNYEHLGLEKGQLYTVSNIEEDKLKLSTHNSSHTVDPAQFHKAVFEKKQIEIAEGDRLKWTKNDARLDRRNGQEFDVIEINHNIATIQYDNGRTDEINLNQPQNLDHALVSTTYSSQGKTANRVMVSATSDRTLSKESFYVAASRAKYNLDIYAQDKKQLLEKAIISQAKQNPLEVLENDLDIKSSTHKEIRDRVERNVRSIYDLYVAKQINDKSLDSQQQQPSKDLVTKSKSESINSAPENERSQNLQPQQTKRRGRRM